MMADRKKKHGRNMQKTTLREIRQSFGRYIAILAIVALGVGFFAGLKITRTSMVQMADGYWKEMQLFDYRLLSTIGFEETDVEKLQEAENVRTAEGSISADILYVDQQQSESVMKVHLLPEKVNGIRLVEGRMPEAGNECVADAGLYTKEQIGSKLVLSPNNEEEDLEMFSYEEYTIVGIAQSSYYVNFERGNTALGTGKVSGFMYIPKDGFSCDYYTEIFVKFDEDLPVYSEEYDAYMDMKEEVWEELCRKQTKERFSSIQADAQQEIDDAAMRLWEEQADAQAKLDEAWQELLDAQAEVSKGEEEIANALEQLDASEQELKEKEELLKEQKEELEARMVAAAQYGVSFEKAEEVQAYEADAGKPAVIPQGMQEMWLQTEAAENQIEEGQAAIGAVEGQTEEKMSVLEAEESRMAEGQAAIGAAESQIEAGKKAIEEARSEIADKQQELEQAKEEIAEGREEYDTAKAEFDEKINEAQEELTDAQKKLDEMEEAESYVLKRNTNVGYACFENDSAIIDGIGNVIPIFFFLVAALVCMTTMNRMVEEQRTQIGVLKALGYGNGVIMSKYLFYSGSAAVTGCILGFFGGTWLFPKVIWKAYCIMYTMEEVAYVFSGELAAISMIAAILCSMGATWFTCRNELSEAAANLMRPKSPKSGKRVFLEHIPFLWKRMKFLHKVSIRNIFRYKKRFFMMVIGISGCTALLVTGFGIKDSVADVADMQFEQIQIYDMSVTFKEGQSDAVRTAFQETAAALVEKYAYFCEKSIDLEFEEQVKTVNLVVFQEQDMKEFLQFHTTADEAVELPGGGECILSHQLAENYGIGIGDVILLRDGDMNRLEVTVSGIFENFIYNYVYINAETYEQETGKEAEFKTAYLNLKEGQDVHRAAADLMKLEEVSAVTVNADTRERLANMMQSLDYVVLLIICCAAFLAFIVLYNLTNINITERIREIATLKVLGFYKAESASYVFRENLILTVIGTGVGLLLGTALHAFVMKQINVDIVAFDVCIRKVSYGYSVFLTMLFACIVNLFMSGKLEKINMAESLKSVD